MCCLVFCVGFFFFTHETAYELRLSLVGSDMCVRDRDVTINDSTDSDVLPCPHFEGVGKRIEIDFRAGGLLRRASPTSNSNPTLGLSRFDKP